MTLGIVQFLSVVLTALALIPGGAHLLELPVKLGVDQQAYFTIQQIYRGWALFGIVFAAALAANLAMAWLTRRDRRACGFAIAAALLLVAFFVIFFLWTFPANVATANWTIVPDNWEQLRRQWEYSHAVNAVVTVAALCGTVLSVLSSRVRSD